MGVSEAEIGGGKQTVFGGVRAAVRYDALLSTAAGFLAFLQADIIA